MLASGLPDNPTCRLEALSITKLLGAIGPFTDEELVATELVKFIAVGMDFATILFSSDCFLHPFRHPFGAAYQAEILGAASGAEMADVEQTKKIIPFVTCKVFFGQYVCHLVFGVNVFDLDFGVQIGSVKQPIRGNSVGS